MRNNNYKISAIGLNTISRHNWLIFLILFITLFSVSAEAQYSLLVSHSADRSSSTSLDGSTISGNAYIFIGPENGISQVAFYLDDSGLNGSPRQIERIAPYDFAGTAANNLAYPFDTKSLADGVHTVSAVVSLSAGGSETLQTTFSVENNAGSGSEYQLLVSTSADRSAAAPLEGQTPTGNIYIFITPENNITQVRFFLDDPAMNNAPRQTENLPAYDFAGTASSNLANPFDVTTLADGVHTVSAQILLSNGSQTSTSASFSIGSIAPDITPPSVPANVTAFAPGGSQVNISWDASTDIGGIVSGYEVHRDDIGLVATVTGTGYTDTNVTPDHTYAYSVLAFDNALPRNESALSSPPVNVTTPASSGCYSISPLDCSSVRINGDYFVSFSGSEGGIPDSSGMGTGFTMVDPPTYPGNPLPDPVAPGYWADRLAVNTSTGKLKITTTPGIQYQTSNNLDNALGVGLNLPSATITLKTTLSEFATGPGGWAQAGLWFGGAGNFGLGTSEDNYIKLVAASPSNGTYAVQALMERAGANITSTTVNITANPGTVILTLVMDPVNRSVQALYNTGSGDQTLQNFTNVPDEWFSFDQAGIDPSVATRSYGGIFATARNAASTPVFTFDSFSVSQSTSTQPEGDLAFTRWTLPVPAPTSLVVGPDHRLYVTELLGTIHALTLDYNSHTVVNDQVINTIRSAHGGDRMTLGITVDPASTPDNVVLWASHSSGSINNGAQNSGIISRLSGSDFSTIDDRITGLPRAIANHGLNSLHFGPDGILYIAAGGNTGAGAPNLSGSEFGDRPEQPLSAAILAADVNDPGFEGDCATPIGQFGIPPTCDVVVYASGLRNAYDFVWHHNGSLYAPENGLGVTGTYPPFASPPCTGLADPNTNNPGVQADFLYRVLPGKYYGHPNPYRNQCVFKNGTQQGVPPLANYQPPIFNLGFNRSADGTIEYLGDAFFSKLMGDLLIANYSVGDDISRIELAPDGTSVTNTQSLIGGFQDPLPLAQDKAGNIYVGEISANRVSILVPLPIFPEPAGAWSILQSMPEAILDAGSSALDDKLYMVGGSTAAGNVSTLYIYDPVSNTWATGPDMPGPSVVNPAVVAYGGKLYVFGGATGSFTGAVNTAAVYNPDTATWTPLPDMNTARGDATAKVLNGKIFIVGGLAADGSSLDSVEIFDPVGESWSYGPAMQTRRDNAGSAVFSGKLYVFGGRTRNADGSTVNSALTSIEIYDPATASWSYGSPMPTGRRAMAVGTISGRAQVIGGEDPVSSENEEYNPITDAWRSLTPMASGRHGAAAATIRGKVYVAGGSPAAGTAFTNDNSVFAY